MYRIQFFKIRPRPVPYMAGYVSSYLCGTR